MKLKACDNVCFVYRLPSVFQFSQFYLGLKIGQTYVLFVQINVI